MITENFTILEREMSIQIHDTHRILIKFKSKRFSPKSREKILKSTSKKDINSHNRWSHSCFQTDRSWNHIGARPPNKTVWDYFTSGNACEDYVQ